MATEIWVNIGSGNGLLPDGTKPLPEPMLTDHQWSPGTFILGWFHKRCLNHQSLKVCLKITCLKFYSDFPGANELTLSQYITKITWNKYNSNYDNKIKIVHWPTKSDGENFFPKKSTAGTPNPSMTKLPACTTASRTTVATIATNSSANLKFVWLNPGWCYWVLTVTQPGLSKSKHQISFVEVLIVKTCQC